MKRYIRSAYHKQTGQEVDDSVLIQLLTDKYKHRKVGQSLLKELERLYNIEIAYAVCNKLSCSQEVTCSDKVYASGATKAKFDTSSTHFSYYDNFLNPKDLEYMQKSKNRTGRIVMMSPREYYDECVNNIFQGRVSLDSLRRQREYSKDEKGSRLIDNYREDMENGDTFPLCYINYADNGQEGLHRMYAAGEAFGWDIKYPVLVVEPYNKKIHEQDVVSKEVEEFEYFEFKDIVDSAIDDIADWASAPPANVEKLFKNAIETHSKESGYNVEVECKIGDEVDGYPMLEIYITKFNDVELENPKIYKDSPYLEDMFKLSSKDSEEDIDIDEELDDIDVDDIEFADFFFK